MGEGGGHGKNLFPEHVKTLRAKATWKASCYVNNNEFGDIGKDALKEQWWITENEFLDNA